MNNNITPPRGMRDFLPAEKLKRENVLTIIRKVFKKNGFEEIETPVMEDYTRIKNSGGGENTKMSFDVMRRRLESKDIQQATSPKDLVDLGLRYDLTVPLARFYATNRGKLPKPFKTIQIGPVWRAERPQEGRYRQFIQCDIDIIGDESIMAEAELIQTITATLNTLQIPTYKIRFNTRTMLDAFLNLCEVPNDFKTTVLTIIDKMDKIGRLGVVQEIQTLSISEDSKAKLNSYIIRPIIPESKRTLDAVGLGDMLPSGTPTSVKTELLDFINIVDPETQKYLVFDPFLVRGMDYYTGLIFEIAVPDKQYSIGGGGRYNGLLTKLTGEVTPAVGISLGFERLMETINLERKTNSKSIVLFYKQQSMKEVLIIKKALCDQGYKVRVEKTPRNMKNALERFKDSGYATFAYVNPESTLGTLVIKKFN